MHPITWHGNVWDLGLGARTHIHVHVRVHVHVHTHTRTHTHTLIRTHAGLNAYAHMHADVCIQAILTYTYVPENKTFTFCLLILDTKLAAGYGAKSSYWGNPEPLDPKP